MFSWLKWYHKLFLVFAFSFYFLLYQASPFNKPKPVECVVVKDG